MARVIHAGRTKLTVQRPRHCKPFQPLASTQPAQQATFLIVNSAKATHAFAWASIVAPSLTSNLPGASMLSVTTLPSLTSIE